MLPSCPEGCRPCATMSVVCPQFLSDANTRLIFFPPTERGCIRSHSKAPLAIHYHRRRLVVSNQPLSSTFWSNRPQSIPLQHRHRRSWRCAFCQNWFARCRQICCSYHLGPSDSEPEGICIHWSPHWTRPVWHSRKAQWRKTPKKICKLPPHWTELSCFMCLLYSVLMKLRLTCECSALPKILKMVSL